jgi:hypothetical protein
MFLKQTNVVPAGEEIILEKPRAVVVFNGELKALEEELARLQKEHAKRFPNSEEKFSAVIAIAPLYDGMEQERVMRTRKLKNDDGSVKKNPDGTEQTEDYESKRRFIDPSKISLSQKGYAIEEGRPFYVSMSLFDTPARSVANASSSSEPEDSDESNDEPTE